MASRIRIQRRSGEPGRPTRGPLSKAKVRLILVGAVLAAFFILSLVITRNYFEVAEVTLPDTVGMSSDQAIQSLERLELEVNEYTEYVEGAPVDTVTSQSPTPGTVVRRGRSVSIGVNVPAEDTQVPRLVGLDLNRADRLLTDLKLSLGQVRYEFSNVPVGEVLDQSPRPGEVISSDQSITLTLSRGPEPAVRELPDLRGLDLEEAREKLEELGFRRIEEVATSLSFNRPGTVIGQNPSAGRRIGLGSPVVLEYALSSRRVVPVPNLEGVSLDRAQRLLRAAELEVAWLSLGYVNDPEKPEGIIDYQPRDYTLPGTPVVLTINGAPSGANAPVRLLEPGDGRLGDNAFDGGQREFGANDGRTGLFGDLFNFGEGADGRDVGAAQDAGEVGRRTAAESLVEGARRVPIRFQPAEYGLPADQTYEFILRIKDDRGDRIGVQRSLPPGASIDTSVVVYGQTLLQIELDGTIYTAWNPY